MIVAFDAKGSEIAGLEESWERSETGLLSRNQSRLKQADEDTSKREKYFII